MKKLYYVAFVAMSVNSGYTQTELYNQNFETAPAINLNTNDLGGAASGENPWVINNIYPGGMGSFFCAAFAVNFPFTVPAAPTQPGGIFNSPSSTYLHVTPKIAIDNGVSQTASYVAADGFCIFGGQSTFSEMSGDISTVGYDSVTLDLWWMCGGSTSNYGEVYYSTDAGVTWNSVTNPESGTAQWRDETTWIESQAYNAAWADQPTLRFGFRFVMGATAAGSELDPGFAIDDIVITGHVLTSCTETTNTLNISACDEYISPSGNYTWIMDGTYMDTIPNTAGCDSVLTINLDINTVDLAVTQDGLNLTSDQTGATSYQWLDCGNGFAEISGAISQTYVATANGGYAVEVTFNGCTDTTSCFVISNIGIESIENDNILIYPNPVNDFFSVLINETSEFYTLELIDISGRIVQTEKIFNGENNVELGTVESGIFYCTVKNQNGEIILNKILVKN